MDDLNEKLNRLLSSPEGLEKIQSVMAALGKEQTAPPPAPDTDKGLPDLTLLSKLAPMMSTFGKEDEDTRLLQALRPYLHGEREQRLDDTVKLLRLTKLLPLLQENGLLGGDKGKLF